MIIPIVHQKNRNKKRNGFIREMHINRNAREEYALHSDLFTYNGTYICAHFSNARLLSQRMNNKRDLIHSPETAVHAADINAFGLIEEILHYIIDTYKEVNSRTLFKDALKALEKSAGIEETEKLLGLFLHNFPPREVHNGGLTIEEYLENEINGERGTEAALEELLLLWIANENPACAPFAELFEESELENRTIYTQAIRSIRKSLEDSPPVSLEGESLEEMLAGKSGNRLSLLELLLSPIRNHPDSLLDQLTYIRKHWGHVLGDYLMKLLRSLDYIREEKKARLPGPGPSRALYFGGEEEVERFSPDQGWMPEVVLLAKSTYVWLDQLSKSYGYEIRTLDQIPDQEIDSIASQGFTGLWLIGIWQRSEASKRIKQLTGNQDAIASAYSLMNYEIADDLGGWDALVQLRNKCMKRGVRLASDMVPNHTGIDSDWMERHPDWFVQAEHPPFPGYTFNGENLSHRPGMQLYLEDHYFDKTDASVVFKRVDPSSGHTRYIYHGNDGTSMPWNDTAQLNYLNPDVREAVIQTIIHVAKNFPIIRFDAAMTLAKKHFQRLWFPEPGSGGDIPSRAEQGLTKDQFNQAIPREFWRDVVDRISQEVPDTLLLAEAFWMMEGYFVRTLGMHRVYNSAFMNMLKREENDKYRETIKNTVSFDKDILKRFVNFMNNPDEDTAVAQFGKEDKYFAVCVLMATMPGLPMFGHGQVQGYTEKYGMEYRKALMEETPDPHLVARHEHEIFPLLKRRHLFAGVDNFLLYTLLNDSGGVNENVFAYSNQADNERALVVVNNSYEQARGRIHWSESYVEKTGSGKEHHKRELSDALGLSGSGSSYLIFQEQRSRLWYIRNSGEIKNRGLYLILNGYQYNVFLNMYEVSDDDRGHYRRLHDELNGRGVPDIDLALQELAFGPLYESYFRCIDSAAESAKKSYSGSEPLKECYKSFVNRALEFADLPEKPEEISKGFGDLLEAADYLFSKTSAVKSHLPDIEKRRDYLHHYLLLEPLNPKAEAGSIGADLQRAGDLAERWLIRKKCEIVWEEEMNSRMNSFGWYQLLFILLNYRDEFDTILFPPAQTPPRPVRPKSQAFRLAKLLFQDLFISEYLQVHESDGTVWYNKERFDEVLAWINFSLLSLHLRQLKKPELKELKKADKEIITVMEFLEQAEKETGYKVDGFLDFLNPTVVSRKQKGLGKAKDNKGSKQSAQQASKKGVDKKKKS